MTTKKIIPRLIFILSLLMALNFITDLAEGVEENFNKIQRLAK